MSRPDRLKECLKKKKNIFKHFLIKRNFPKFSFFTLGQRLGKLVFLKRKKEAKNFFCFSSRLFLQKNNQNLAT
jgi:hypothetical protein